MRKYLVTALLIFAFCNNYAQNEPENFRFYFFPKLEIGFFNPADVNNYILEDLTAYDLQSGSEDLILNFTVGLGVGMKIIKYIELQFLGEYSVAPKWIIVTNGDNLSYTFSKYSAGVLARINIPIRSDFKHSAFIGGGMFYNVMDFEQYGASSLNPRFQAGFSINNWKFNPQISLTYDMAKATDDHFENFELDYSSFRIGVNLNF